VTNYRTLSLRQANELAAATARTLLSTEQHLHVWDLPDWMGEYFEDDINPNDFVEDDKAFVSQLERIKQLIKEGKRPAKEDYEVSKVHATRKGPSAFPDPDSYSENHYPWYKTDDPEVYLVCWNVTDRVIKAGDELTLSYGDVSNRYLNKWYGFCHNTNPYDSLCFRLIPAELMAGKPASESVWFGWIHPRETSLTTQDGKQIAVEEMSQEYRAKYHRLHMPLISDLRHVLGGSASWIAVNQKGAIKLPESLEKEIKLLSEYKSIFEKLSKVSGRQEIDFQEIFLQFREGKIDYSKYCIALCEHAHFKIATYQMRLADLAITILQDLISRGKPHFKEIYMQTKIDGKLSEHEDFELRYGLAYYLEQVYFC